MPEIWARKAGFLAELCHALFKRVNNTRPRQQIQAETVSGIRITRRTNSQDSELCVARPPKVVFDGYAEYYLSMPLFLLELLWTTSISQVESIQHP
jgi:hypothetical protein